MLSLASWPLRSIPLSLLGGWLSSVSHPHAPQRLYSAGVPFFFYFDDAHFPATNRSHSLYILRRLHNGLYRHHTPLEPKQKLLKRPGSI